jgi:hypothetical protein
MLIEFQASLSMLPNIEGADRLLERVIWAEDQGCLYAVSVSSKRAGQRAIRGSIDLAVILSVILTGFIDTSSPKSLWISP